MVQNSAPNSNLFPPQPVPEGAEAFTDRVHGLLDGQPKDEATVRRALEGMDAMFDMIAAGLYNLASMLVGEGEESVRLVEKAVATTDVSTSDGPLEARKSSRMALAKAALDAIVRREPGSLAAPKSVSAPVTCIEDDDLDAAGVSAHDLERMISGPDRARVREWLAKLSAPVRTVFALRAVAGFTSGETAGLLAAHGGPDAARWSPESVRDVFRQGLCSLASQLLHASAAR
ncbi:MAG TPA: hypothetical protein VFB43_20275 [Terracidiphilus sp.]|jgi:DNA-directed RNA polymerase specialized sigma24 family protein|nr:hypothetical protein [Terracidiphilus sp.]